MPSTPPDMKMMVANSTATVADFAGIKPSFVKRKDLFVGEGVDLSLFTAADDEDDKTLVAAK